MRAEDRQREILRLARSRGRIAVCAVAAELSVAAETVRRDLRALSDRGLLRRTHGGAEPVETASFETALSSRVEAYFAEKQRIATAAARLLSNAETVFVDEGHTAQLVAETLPRDHVLTIVTASLPAAITLAASTHTVLLLGGRVRGLTMATVDQWTLRTLRNLTIDLAFLGANGISADQGLTTPDPAVAAVKSTAVTRARRRIFVGAHSKFGVVSFVKFADVGDFETLVTDTGLSRSAAHRLQRCGPQVVRA